MIFDKRDAEKIIFYDGDNALHVINFWNSEKTKHYGQYLTIIDDELYYKPNDYEPQYDKPLVKNSYVTFKYDEDDWWWYCPISIEEYEKNFIEVDGKKNTIAKRLHDSFTVQEIVEDTIDEAFEKYEPEIYKDLEFTIGSDYYDNSIEIYIKNHIPYPYEPSWQIRDEIYKLGFSIVYWNFVDENGDFTEEIRGTEPRRYKRAPEYSDAEWCKYAHNKWGMSCIDKRFDGSWFDKYQKK